MDGRLVNVGTLTGGGEEAAEVLAVEPFASNIEAVYRNDAARLVGLAEWIVGSRAVAEELVQDAFAKVVERPPRLEDPHALSAYVRSAVVNGCRSKIRCVVLERKHKRTESETYEDPDRPNEQIRLAVHGLPMRQRQVVVLRFYEDLTVDQIAATLNIGSGSVKTHLHRALSKLGNTLDERTEP